MTVLFFFFDQFIFFLFFCEVTFGIMLNFVGLRIMPLIFICETSNTVLYV